MKKEYDTLNNPRKLIHSGFSMENAEDEDATPTLTPLPSLVNNGRNRKSTSSFLLPILLPLSYLSPSLLLSLSLMAFQLRKLLSDSDGNPSETCSSFCADDYSSGYCPTACLSVCPVICRLPISSFPPPPPPQIFAKAHKFSLLAIYLLSILSFCFVMALLFAYYRRFHSRRFASPARSSLPPSESNSEFVDEEEGPILDHPIWYIRTVGLQPSLIGAITICKYKRGDGLIEGTDCSVCLTEFEEDEDLRLLPKCNHAFHLPCIDTWLRSHTNCPLCRAPVAAVALPPEPAPVISGQEEEVQPDNSQNTADSSNREDDDETAVVEDGVKRLGENSGAGEGEMQPVRRSVSLDSLSAFLISSALSHVLEAPKTRSDHLELAKMSSNRKGKAKILHSLVSGSSSAKAASRESMKRSLSCTSKFFQRSSSTQRKNGVIPR